MAWDQNAASWTALELLSDVRRVASVPVTSTDFTDAVLYREATDALWSFAGWAIQQAGEGRLSDLFARPVTGLLTSPYRSATECELPPLAIGDTLESVAFLDTLGQTETRLQRIDHAVQSDYDRPTSEGVPRAYSMLGGRLRLYPRPSQGGTIRIVYQRRHPHLCADTRVNTALVLAVESTTTTTTTLSMTGGQGTNFTPAITAGETVDLLSSQYPYRALLTNVPVSAQVLGTVTLTVAPALLSGLNLTNARLVRAGQTPFVHYPLELRPAVNEKVAAAVMRRFGDLTNAQASEQAAAQELGRVLTILSPRSKRDRPKAVNPYSHLRGGLRAGWRPR